MKDFKTLTEELPEPFRNIEIITKDGETIQSKTYKHNRKLFVEFLYSPNQFFEGMSIELFNKEKTLWRYI